MHCTPEKFVLPLQLSYECLRRYHAALLRLMRDDGEEVSECGKERRVRVRYSIEI